MDNGLECLLFRRDESAGYIACVVVYSRCQVASGDFHGGQGLKYVARRLSSVVPTLLLVSVMIFWLMRILPGDVATLILIGPEGTGQPTATEVTELKELLGLDKPMVVQWADWMLGMMKLDVGPSLWSGEPVFQELFRRLPLTIELGVMATTTSLLIAIPMGIIAAVKRGSWMDYASRVFVLGGLSIPSFWVSVLTILALVTYFNWTPPLGYVALTKDPFVNFQQLIWAALALGYIQAALVARMTRSSLLEVMREDYIRTARAKGVRDRNVVIKHALKNSMLPVVTVVGIGMANIIGGTVILETLWSLPGVGRFMVDAINHRDYPVVQTLTFIFALIFAVTNLAVDLVYGVLDPRIRLD
ncbi:MAG: ABC transporter permease [Dehalococcoidia bacterium]|nr:MAG: ABC transporter permease [Dehalococcoidia bacterium]